MPPPVTRQRAAPPPRVHAGGSVARVTARLYQEAAGRAIEGWQREDKRAGQIAGIQKLFGPKNLSPMGFNEKTGKICRFLVLNSILKFWKKKTKTKQFFSLLINFFGQFFL
jgi:hypothetical protein